MCINPIETSSKAKYLFVKSEIKHLFNLRFNILE